MSDSTERTNDLKEISEIRDPDVRRALRAMHRDLVQSVERHQVEIEALVQIMLEKHVMSMSEYKLHLSRLQQGQASLREGRVHEELASIHRAKRDATSRPAEMPETTTNGRYRLDG